MPDALAHAKLNLCLAVAPPEPAANADGTPNRRAGWHRISSWFACTDLADRVQVERTDAPGTIDAEIRFATQPNGTPIGAVDWPIEKDLAVRALRAMLDRVGGTSPSAGFRLRIEKHIPTGGGLGGGSSNAAAALRLGNETLGSSLSAAELRTIGAKLGSDVPFFIDDAAVTGPARPALVEGFGDRIERTTPIPDLAAVLVMPSIACPTPAVYRAFDTWLTDQSTFRFRDAEARSLATRAPDAGGDLNQLLFNDLAEPAMRVAPGLRSVHAACERVRRPFHVTGSGSTLFTLVAPAEADALSTRLRAALPANTRVLAARVLG
jgi:4-diphosphocytidyl-2-C-methyl-D-erythritol kinase